MKILSIHFKNFASYGNKIQKIEFNEDKSHLILLTGVNGAGKSTVANVIKFLLYGKVDGVNLTDLPNRINKNLWGKIKIFSKGKYLEIERGLSPNIFKVFIDNKEYDQAGKLNVQDYMEREFFGMPFNVFKNIIILSINEFKSFITMNPGDKKSIVDRLFGFSVINEMRQIIKEKKKGVEEEINSYEKELGIITQSITSVNSKLNDLQKSSNIKNEEKIQELKNKLLTLKDDKIKLLDAKKKVDDSLKEYEKITEKLKKKYNEKKSDLEKIEHKLKLYENDKCPECESDLTTSFHKDKKNSYKELLNILPIEIKECEKEIINKKEKFIQIRDAQHKIISKNSSIEANMDNMKKDLIQIVNKKNSGEEFQHLENLIKESRVKEQERHKDKIEKSDEFYFLKLVEEILGEDSGIKNLAMKMILPALNGNISSLLKKVHLPFNIIFDDKFNANITSLGEKINPKSLSTGERKKADFIIIIALIKLTKLRYPTLNILFLDEIFSSLDGDSRYVIINVLREVIKEIDLNTFIINHSSLPTHMFDVEINIEKNGGFSNIIVASVT